MTRSQSVTPSFACSSSLRDSWSTRAISRFFSRNGLPVRDASTSGAGHQLEAHPELVPQLVLPLLDQAARGDDQTAGDVATQASARG